MMKATYYLFFFLTFALISCDKENGLENAKFDAYLDSLSIQRYYTTDILLPEHSNLYNIWKLTHVTGGFVGGEHPLTFDYMIFKPNGIYGIIMNDSIKEFGRVNILEQTKERLLISLTPDLISEQILYDSEKQVDLSHNDTLMLIAPCCDRFSYEFVKQNK